MRSRVLASEEEVWDRAADRAGSEVALDEVWVVVVDVDGLVVCYGSA